MSTMDWWTNNNIELKNIYIENFDETQHLGGILFGSSYYIYVENYTVINGHYTNCKFIKLYLLFIPLNNNFIIFKFLIKIIYKLIIDMF